MKNYNRRGLIIGIVQLLLSAFCLITMIVTNFDVETGGFGNYHSLVGNYQYYQQLFKRGSQKRID